MMEPTSPRSPPDDLKVFIKRDIEKEFTGRIWTGKEKKLWIMTLFVGCMMLYAARTVMPLCIVAVAKELKWNKSESGLVLSCFFWGYTTTQVLGGYLSDRIGGDIVLTVAAIGWSFVTYITPYLATVYTSHSATLNLLVLSRVLLGACQGVHYPSFTSIVSRRVDRDRSLIYAFIAAGAHCGTLFCGSIGSLVLYYYGWQDTFYLVGTCGFLWMFFLRFVVIPREKRRSIVLSLTEDVSQKKAATAKNTSVPWCTIFSSLAFWSLVVGHFCQNYAFFILLSWLPTYFHENFPEAKGWVFNVLPWVLTIITAIFSGWIADKLIAKGKDVTFVRKLMEGICLLGIASSLILISYVHTYHGALFFTSVAVMSCGFHHAGILVNGQEIAPKFAGSVFGIMNMAGAIPGFIGVYVVGHILEISHSWSFVFNQTAFVALIGFVVYTSFGTAKKIA